MKKKNQELKREIENLDIKRLMLHKKEKSVVPFFLLVPFTFFLSQFLFKQAGLAFVISLFSLFLVYGFYYNIITAHFNSLKTKLREALLENFIETYHPNVEFRYFPGIKDVKEIIKSANLISATIYKEEDVIQGEMDETTFYLSEIHLKKKSGKTERTVFKGLLFRLNIKGKNFPQAKIQSSPEFMKRLFNGLEKNEENNFYYESDDLANIKKHIGPLFPFIKHLIKNNNDVRIKIEGDELILMLESDIKFLDDPKPRIGESFDNKEYYNKLAQHLNSFFFIIESLASGANALELEEKMKVKLEQYKSVSQLRDDHL